MKKSIKLFLVVSTFTASVLSLMAQEEPNAADAAALATPDNVEKAPDNAEVTASGLASIVLTPGTGKGKPSAEDVVTVHYSGWQSSDGELFDSSLKRGEPASFPLNGVIRGWTEGLQLMVTGEKRRFWIPEDLAYGPKQEGSGRPGGQLVFDVELLSFKKAPETTFEVVEAGEGEAPVKGKNVKFHITFYDPEGKVAQSSKDQPTPPVAPLEQLPPDFQKILSALKPGGMAKAAIPGQKIGAPYDIVNAEFELLEVIEPTPPPAAPADVAAAPEDAKKTESGLAYKVLKEGEGGAKPTEASNVTVHYTGWETSGEMFDSSVTRGEPTSFPLGQVIPGWTEGLQLMSKGDTFRFWIPEGLAYGPKQEGSNRPGGLLVFDVELIDFK